MFRSSQLFKLPIIALNNGQTIGTVENLVIDPQRQAIAALVLAEHRNPSYCKIIPFNRVRGIGSYAVTVDNHQTPIAAKDAPEILSILKDNSAAFLGKRVISKDGQLLGTVDEFHIDPKTGRVSALEISGRLLHSLLKGRYLLPVRFVETIGRDTIITKYQEKIRLEPVPTKVHETFHKVKSHSAKVWETSKRWTNTLGKTIQEMTADEYPPDKKS